ncbi:MAG: glutathione peroxidase [Bacteroidetes bacterium GWF2_33_16]|nr:MAG: glutathione peroxidase [Bacteroidetes bacterium GWE2_32_14]OFY07032.1 MAG: glutathione peroxidase [Bacteroidetes bacterium GWF2_33_16]
MKRISVFFAFMLAITTLMAQTKTLYDFKVNDIDGKEFDLSTLKGKKVLVVNTASKCGFTPQYTDLQKLYEKYGSDKFVIIGFPANNFMSQEPGSNDEIKEFCSTKYNVTFPMMAKISVKGKDIHPLYEWLTSKELNGVMDSNVKWNFQKYMIDENGKLFDVAYSKTNPLDEQIVKWITGK